MPVVRATGKGENQARADRAVRDWMWVLGDERGRRVVQSVYEATGFERDLPPEPSAMLVAAGRREVGLRIREAVKEINPQLFALMEAEYAAPPEMRLDEDRDDIEGA
jgi:hypothetical protein